MRKLALLVTVAAMAGSFGIGNAIGQLQRGLSRPSLSLEGITGKPAEMVTPKPSAAPDASAGVPPGWTLGPVPAGQTMVLRYERGGSIAEHYRRFQAYALYDHAVEVRGLCISACTIVMSTVARSRICFGRDAALLFHLASNGEGPNAGKTNMDASISMFERFPADIRAWIDAQGGVRAMPGGGFNFWTLSAPELWKMGYRRCPD